ncbi:hypothetical protein ACVNPS_08595 [Candidatus Bipolaricaulota sp. J31]
MGSEKEGAVGERMICGLIIGEAESPGKARDLAGSFKDCPYCSLVGAFGEKFVWVCFVPEDHRWWLESIRERPGETLGLKGVELLVTGAEEVPYPTFTLRIPEEKLEVCPCGARCDLCELYGRCPGCPATVFHRGQVA